MNAMEPISHPFPDLRSGSPRHWNLWLQWVGANALGEMIGLGIAAMIGVGVASTMDGRNTVFAVGLTGVAMILAGTIEGVVVGIAQSMVLCRYLRELRGKAWVTATAIGAFVAWVLGMIPSTVMNLREPHDSQPAPEMSGALMHGLAALMGIVLGVILALPQWRVLRRHVTRAGWWLAANSLAWAIGMPVIFLGIGAMHDLGMSFGGVIIGMLVTTVLAGAVVGAIHGLALVWLVRQPDAGRAG
ncbi:MAG: hypothetical protein SF339_01395 [Blastocatellia bacterium]|nr:hypothetical protein [Blastocatellia bacterium]